MLGPGHKPLAELLRHWRQQQVVNSRLVLAAEPFAVVTDVQVDCGRVPPHSLRERLHQVRVATPGFPHVQGDRAWRRDTELLLQQVE